MGKTLIQQARGHGSKTYRVRRKAFSIHPGYPKELDEEYIVAKLISSAGHSIPIAILKSTKSRNKFYNFAVFGMFEGQRIKSGGKNNGDISELGKLDNGTQIINIECRPKDGGKFVRTGGNSAVIAGKEGKQIIIRMPSKHEIKLDERCRATIGVASGAGKLDKPILKAGKQHYIKRAKQKLWPRTSAVKMNAIDHPFGSGRGKRPKSKIAKNNAPPGAKVGFIHPRRTGRTKK
jgi:large subunit ribosomal protein L2